MSAHKSKKKAKKSEFSFSLFTFNRRTEKSTEDPPLKSRTPSSYGPTGNWSHLLEKILIAVIVFVIATLFFAFFWRVDPQFAEAFTNFFVKAWQAYCCTI